MKIVIAIAVLCLVGCTTQTLPSYKSGTFSTYSSGNHTQETLRACAEAVFDEYEKDPTIDADALFVGCYKELGVRFI